MQSVKIEPVTNNLRGNLRFPGDKSLSHRAIIFGALAEGISVFTNILNGEDCRCTRKAFEAMGVRIHCFDPDRVEIHGRGLTGLSQPTSELYLGNSGTSMRLLMGLLSAQPFRSVLTGDASLSRRPMSRVVDPLRRMGAHIQGNDGGNYAPLIIDGGPLWGIEYPLSIPSAQVKSAILLAGLYAHGATTVREPVRSRDHTEKFLHHFGAQLIQDQLSVTVAQAPRLHCCSFEIAGDISSAAFFMAIEALLPDRADFNFESILWNPTRTGIVEVLARMGAEIQMRSFRKAGPEDVSDFGLQVGSLRAVTLESVQLPALIDEIPILTVLATQARGTTVIHDAHELRVKETDRIASMTANLTKMGAKIRVEGNTLVIEGPTPLTGAVVNSMKDHRTAMSLVVAGMIARGQTVVEDVECIDTSFPSFFKLLKRVGVDFELLTR